MLPASKPSTSFGKMTGRLYFDFGLSCLIPTKLWTRDLWRFPHFNAHFCFVFTLICFLMIATYLFRFFFCLEFIVPLENFSLIWRVTVTDKRLQILTYARNLMLLNIEGSLACHTYCDTVRLFAMSSFRTNVTHIFCRAFDSGAVTLSTCF